MRETTLRAVIEAIAPELHLHHLAGSLERKLAVLDERLWPADLVGHLNLIHPGRVQIVGIDKRHRQTCGERQSDSTFPAP